MLNSNSFHSFSVLPNVLSQDNIPSDEICNESGALLYDFTASRFRQENLDPSEYLNYSDNPT